jgi:hypothetical protein
LFLLITVNVLAVVGLIISNYIVEKALAKHLFYEVGFLELYKYVIAPLIIFTLNMAIYINNHNRYSLLSVLVLILPIYKFINVCYNDKMKKDVYRIVSQFAVPIIINEFKNLNVVVQPSDIIIASSFRDKKPYAEVTVKLKEKNENCTYITKHVKTILEKEIKNINVRIFYEIISVDKKKALKLKQSVC